jgi:hypothetical protein
VTSERWFPTAALARARRFARRVKGEVLMVPGGWLVRWSPL